ncbi:hypothetical protein FRC10_003044 [Ceratobasidium sp. 414]|nr:hypothetical protein FRC10_003044 [Ceratobasidium sp. 414]
MTRPLLWLKAAATFAILTSAIIVIDSSGILVFVSPICSPEHFFTRDVSHSIRDFPATSLLTSFKFKHIFGPLGDHEIVLDFVSGSFPGHLVPFWAEHALKCTHNIGRGVCAFASVAYRNLSPGMRQAYVQSYA